MIPSRLLVLLMLGPVGLALLTLLDDSLLPVMLGTDAAVAGLAALDAVWGYGRQIRVRREVRSVFSVGRNNPVTLHLFSEARRPLTVEVTDDTFALATVEGLPGRVELPPGGQARVRYQLRPKRRGAYRLGATTVRYSTPLRLFTRQLQLPGDDAIHVYPDVQAVRAYELLARQDRAYAMVSAARQPGGNNEFERLREYTRDDEFRSIDWKATARRQKLIARQYQLERNQTIEIILDSGRLMTVPAGDLPLFDHALNASLLLAHVAARGGDRVGLMAFSDRLRAAVAPTAGRAATVRMVRATYDLHPELVEPDYEAVFSRLAGRLRQRTLVVIITRVNDDVSADALARHTRSLIPRHLPLVILLRDPELEVLARVRDDDDEPALFVRAAAAEMLGWYDQVIRRLRRHGAHVLDVEPRQLTVGMVSRYLEIKSRHLL